ncbi:MAG: hypothetical protein M3Q08_02150 [Pseudomonadota bacterium]|nr:hypothetical protein [Pseudomonadota bacterium]
MKRSDRRACVPYRRIRPVEPEASAAAIQQQQDEIIRLESEGHEIVAVFTETEFADADEGWLEFRPMLRLAYRTALAIKKERGDCEFAILRCDAIGSGDDFTTDAFRDVPDMTNINYLKPCTAGRVSGNYILDVETTRWDRVRDRPALRMI